MKSAIFASDSARESRWTPGLWPTLTPGASTRTGVRHHVNQDCHFEDVARGLFIVADGMGGCRSGDCASQLAVDRLASHAALLGPGDASCAEVRRCLYDAFVEVDKDIHLMGSLDSRLYGMGTTAVVALVVRDRLYLAHVGDSRAYVSRGRDPQGGNLQCHTMDHNMAQALVNMGAISRAEAKTHHWRNMLSKHLGMGNLPDGPDVCMLSIEAGDRIVLVTDGVTETLDAPALTTILNAHPQAADAAESIVHSAVASGARDDATSVVINIQ